MSERTDRLLAAKAEELKKTLPPALILEHEGEVTKALLAMGRACLEAGAAEANTKRSPEWHEPLVSREQTRD